MRFELMNGVGLPWLIFLAYWAFASVRVNRMVRAEPAGDLVARFVVMLPAFVLLCSNDPRFGDLNRRFVPDDYSVFVAGSALTYAGVAFAIWARYHIAQYWSATVALRADHQLIRTGPYARIRHPIYTGMLLAVIGTAIAVGRYRGLIAFAMILAAFTWKSKREESLLAGQFGPAFEEHRRRTGFFLPRFS